jgi:hypothetical protein
VKTDDISFNLGMKPSYRCNGTYFDSETGKDMFYYTDHSTNKCIKIFDTDFNLTNVVKLDSIPDRRLIRGLQIVNRDIIVIIGGYHPVEFIYVVNFEGKVIKSIELKSLIEADTNDIQLDNPSRDVDFYSNGKVYLKYEFNSKNYFDDYSYNKILHADSMVMNYPFMVSIPFDTVPHTYQKLFDNINKENYNYGYAIDDYACYSIVNGKLFMPIGHNSKLYIADLKTNEIEKILNISSKYTQTGFNIEEYKYSIENHHDLKLDEHIRFHSIAGGFSSIVWDKYRKVYYLVIHHSNPDFDSKKGPYFAKTFSIQILDESFNKKGETKFLTEDYWQFDTRVSPKGLLIQKRGEDYDKNIQKYTLFTISD